MACKRSAVRSRVAPPKSPRDFQEFQNFSFKSIFSLFMLKNKLAYLCFCPVLSGCSMFAFESNVDPDNVVEFDDESLGTVEYAVKENYSTVHIIPDWFVYCLLGRCFFNKSGLRHFTCGVAAIFGFIG